MPPQLPRARQRVARQGHGDAPRQDNVVCRVEVFFTIKLMRHENVRIVFAQNLAAQQSILPRSDRDVRGCENAAGKDAALEPRARAQVRGVSLSSLCLRSTGKQ